MRGNFIARLVRDVSYRDANIVPMSDKVLVKEGQLVTIYPNRGSDILIARAATYDPKRDLWVQDTLAFQVQSEDFLIAFDLENYCDSLREDPT